MTLSDPISDFLVRIRNAAKAEHRYVEIRYSKMKESLAKILKAHGFIEDCMVKQEEDGRGVIRVILKYNQARKPVIQGMKRVSKPGLRRYVRSENIPVFFGGLGVAIVSTSQGVMTGNDAKKKNVGGELLCLVW